MLTTLDKIKLHQEYQQSERIQCLLELKQAYEQGNLRIDFEDRNSLYLLSAFQRREDKKQNQLTDFEIDLNGNSFCKKG